MGKPAAQLNMNSAFSTNGLKLKANLEEDASLALMRLEVQAVLKIKQELPPLFSSTFRYHMERLGMTDLMLASAMQCSGKTIERYKLHEAHPKKRDEVLKACIAFRLPYLLCEDLMQKAGLGFRPVLDDLCVQKLLMLENYTDLFDFNRQLEVLGGIALRVGR